MKISPLCFLMSCPLLVTFYLWIPTLCSLAINPYFALLYSELSPVSLPTTKLLQWFLHLSHGLDDVCLTALMSVTE